MPTLNFYPDADGAVGATTMDGEVRRVGIPESWADIRGAAEAVSATTSVNSLSAAIIADELPDLWHSMYRSVLLFDTSSIPDGATITSASLFLLRNGAVHNDLNQSLYVTSVNPAANTSLAVTDYANFGTTKYNDGISLDSFTSVLVHTEVPLNATGIAAISKTGITKFGLRLGADIDNIEPSWSSEASSSLGVKSADFSGQSSWPYLSVTYESNDLPVSVDPMGLIGMEPYFGGLVGLRPRLVGDTGLAHHLKGS